jgi:hypothetical protein
MNMANRPMMIRERTEVAMEAMCGDCHLGWVLPRTGGSIPSRPRE